MAAGFERIFETGPVFRAEKSYTNKHSTEFSGFDLEFSYITSYKDVMKMEEELLTAGLQAVKDNYGDQIKEMFGQEVIVPTTPFPVVKLADLYKGLEEEFGYTVDESEKGDLTTEAERLSYEWVKKHYGHEFLFITDYSAEKRAFYHMRDENGVPQGYDLIWRGVEITTGAQREHRYEVLKKQAEEKGLADDVKFYLEFFQYGCPPHGGFGIGIDRLTMLLCGLTIKDAGVPVPRPQPSDPVIVKIEFCPPPPLLFYQTPPKAPVLLAWGAFSHHIRPFPNIRLQQADRNPVRCTAQTGRGEQFGKSGTEEHLPRDRRTHRRRYLHWGGWPGAQRQIHLYQAFHGTAGAARHRPGGCAGACPGRAAPVGSGPHHHDHGTKIHPGSSRAPAVGRAAASAGCGSSTAWVTWWRGLWATRRTTSPAWSKARGSTTRCPSTLPPRPAPAR